MRLRRYAGAVTLAACCGAPLVSQAADTVSGGSTASIVSGTSGASTLAPLIRTRQYQEAVRAADQLLQRSPGSAEAWFYRGVAENGLGNEAKALDNLQQSLALDPAMLRAAEAGAQIAYRHQDARARGFLQQVVHLEPGNRTAHGMLGVLALEADNCSAALAEFDLAAAVPDSATGSRLALCKAHLAAQNGDLRTAEADLVALHHAAPADATATRDLAEVLLQESQPAKVVDLLAPLAAELPAASLNLLGGAYARQGNLSLAIESYRQAIARGPLQQDSYLDLATLGMEHQSPEVALSVLDRGLNVNPGAVRLLVMRGTVYAQVGKNDLAQHDFEQADRLQPNGTYGALGMGLLLREDGNLEEAQAVLEKKMRTTPGNPMLSFLLADVLVRRGASPGDAMFTRAVDLLHTTLHAQPDLAPAHALLGKLLLKDGQSEQAIVPP